MTNTCKTCGAPAPTGCCDKHAMECPFCFGDGAVSRETWDLWHGKQIGGNALGRSRKSDQDLKLWFAKQVDEISFHACNSCWSDCRGCTCEEEKARMKEALVTALPQKLERL